MFKNVMFALMISGMCQASVPQDLANNCRPGSPVELRTGLALECDYDRAMREATAQLLTPLDTLIVGDEPAGRKQICRSFIAQRDMAKKMFVRKMPVEVIEDILFNE